MYFLFLMFQKHVVPFVANKDSFWTLNNANSSVSFRKTTQNIIKEKLILAFDSYFLRLNELHQKCVFFLCPMFRSHK